MSAATIETTLEVAGIELDVELEIEGARLGRDALIEALSQRGIGTSVHYVPLHRQPYWRDRYGLTPQMFPHAEAAYQTMVSLPLYTAMSDADQDRIIDALNEILG